MLFLGMVKSMHSISKVWGFVAEQWELVWSKFNSTCRMFYVNYCCKRWKRDIKLIMTQPRRNWFKVDTMQEKSATTSRRLLKFFQFQSWREKLESAKHLSITAGRAHVQDFILSYGIIIRHLTEQIMAESYQGTCNHLTITPDVYPDTLRLSVRIVA